MEGTTAPNWPALQAMNGRGRPDYGRHVDADAGSEGGPTGGGGSGVQPTAGQFRKGGHSVGVLDCRARSSEEEPSWRACEDLLRLVPTTKSRPSGRRRAKAWGRWGGPEFFAGGSAERVVSGSNTCGMGKVPSGRALGTLAHPSAARCRRRMFRRRAPARFPVGSSCGRRSESGDSAGFLPAAATAEHTPIGVLVAVPFSGRCGRGRHLVPAPFAADRAAAHAFDVRFGVGLVRLRPRWLAGPVLRSGSDLSRRHARSQSFLGR